MATKPDLVLFAGPVVVDKTFSAIPWRNPTIVRQVTGSGSDYFKTLAGQLRGQDGRILPNLVSRYAGGTIDDYGGIALSSFSAGWGLLNEVAKIPADVNRLTGFLMMDSAFGYKLEGFRQLAGRAAMKSDKLVFFSNTNNSANPALGILRTGKETVKEIMDGMQADTGRDLVKLSPRFPMPTPSGGVWGAGSLVWYDYVKPGAPANTGNDLTHEQHNYLAAKAWEAYLAPAFAGETADVSAGPSSPMVVYALLMAVLGGALLLTLKRDEER